MEQEVVLDVKVKNQGLKQQLREAVQEAQALQERFGATSKEAINAAKKVANIKEEISDMNQVFKVFNPEEKFNAVVGLTSGIAGGMQAITGAMQLFGTESEDVEKALLKVQAATAFAEGLNNIRSLGDSFSNMKLLVMDTVRNLGAMKAALIATGIGAATVALGLLVANWDKLKAAIFGTTKEQELYNSVQEDVNKQVADASAKMNELKATMQAAKDGTIDKKVALEEYNETMGESLGKVTSFEEAEKRIKQYEKTYIESIRARATAQALYAKAADKAAKAASGEELEPDFWDTMLNSITALGNPTAMLNKQMETIVDKSKKANEDVKALNDLANKEMQNALKAEKEINAESVNDKYEADKKKAEDAKKFRDQQLKEQEEYNNKVEGLMMELIRDEEEKLNAQYDKELRDIQKQYAKKAKQREELETLLSEKYKLLFADLAEKQRKQAEEEAAKDRAKQRELQQKNFEEKQAFDIELLNLELEDLKTKGELTAEEEIRIENEKYALLKANRDLTYLEQERLKTEHEAKIKGINEKAAADAIATEQAKRDAYIQIAQQTLNGITAIAEMGIKNEKKLEQFRKAAALVQIGIDTAMAISSGIANAARFAKNPLMLGLSIATTIATVLTNMAKAKQILASANTGGGTPSLSTAAGGAGTSATTTGGGVTDMQAPQQVGQGIANANAINNALNNPNMIRAVVVETDITDSQRRVRGIEDRATFG